MKQALLPAGPYHCPCQLSKGLPAAVSSPHCQAGACVEGAWERERCFRVECEHLMYSFRYAQFLCPQCYQASLFSAGIWRLPCTHHWFQMKLWWQMCCFPQETCSSLHDTLWCLEVSSEVEQSVCSLQVKCWFVPAEGLPLQNSAPGKVNPILDLSRQTDSTAMSTRNIFLLLYLGVLLSGRIKWR